MPTQDRPPNIWQLHGVLVTIAPDADVYNNYRPDQRYGRLVKEALQSLDDRPLVIPNTVTITGLIFPVKLVVVTNDERTPRWTVHHSHQSVDLPCEQKLSPFVFTRREVGAPMTNCLTVGMTGTSDDVVIKRLHPGPRIPALPWEDSLADSYSARVAFWREHSYVYGIQHVMRVDPHMSSEWFDPPRWYTDH